MNNKYHIIIALALFLLPMIVSAQPEVAISGLTRDAKSKAVIPYVNIVFKAKRDSSFVGGTITNEQGRFTLSINKSGTYIIEAVSAGFVKYKQEIIVGTLSNYLDLGTIELTEDVRLLGEVTVGSSRQKDGISDKIDKKIFTIGNNISQAGGSVLQAMQNFLG